jgi:ubiquinone/menaquinone biosynthesis C-methylase UbiE
LEEIYAKHGRYIHAVLQCSCRRYPILDSVLFLNKDQIAARVLDFVVRRKKWLRGRENIPLFWFRNTFFAQDVAIIASSVIKVFDSLSLKNFITLFKSLGFYKEAWAEYLSSRSNSIEFRSALISLRRIRSGSTILDVASGAGHFLKYLTKVSKEETIWGVESSVVGIYLSKKYFAPRANYVYLNLGNGLPFKKSFFNAVFVNDALHYIKEKRLLCGDIDKITKHGGKIILTNLHNKHQARLFDERKHYPEYPQNYIKLFPNKKYQLFSEEGLYENKLTKVNYKDVATFSRRAKKFTLIFS